MNKKLKILMVVADLASKENPSFQPFVRSQIESIENLGHEIEIFKIHGPDGWYNYFSKMPLLHKVAIKFNPDIVHSHYSYCAFTSLATLKYPQVISFMGDDVIGAENEQGKLTLRSYLHKPFAKIPTQFAQSIIVKSEEMKGHVNHKNVNVVPNGVNFSTFTPIDKNEARKDLGLDINKIYILFPGDIKNPRKRFSLAQSASDVLKNKFNVDHEILHMRTASQEVLNKYYNASDAMIFTSWSEGSPNVVKEAMACNTPIVSVIVGDTPEIIKDTQNCFVGKDDPDLLGSELAKIISDGNRSNGREMINHLEASKIAQQIEQIYFNILPK